jgi:hypothetical protein
MQPSDALSASLQTAVALAGFAGVVVVFRDRAVHEWTRLDKLRLRILLTNSAIPFALALFAMVMLSANLDASLTWRLSSLIAFVVQVMTGASYGKAFQRFPRDEFKASGGRMAVMYAGSLVGVVVTLLQLYNVIRLWTFWPFFVSVATLLFFAMLQFVLLVISGHESASQ